MGQTDTIWDMNKSYARQSAPGCLTSKDVTHLGKMKYNNYELTCPSIKKMIRIQLWLGKVLFHPHLYKTTCLLHILFCKICIHSKVKPQNQILNKVCSMKKDTFSSGLIFIVFLMSSNSFLIEGNCLNIVVYWPSWQRKKAFVNASTRTIFKLKGCRHFSAEQTVISRERENQRMDKPENVMYMYIRRSYTWFPI